VKKNFPSSDMHLSRRVIPAVLQLLESSKQVSLQTEEKTPGCINNETVRAMEHGFVAAAAAAADTGPVKI
jgi:hypothetical protein